jgi:hypothetical protein
MKDRRIEHRGAGEGLRVRVRPGHRLAIIDVSPQGALLEGRSRLRPGARIEVQLESSSHAMTLTAHVTRCTVFAIDAEQGVTYRSALAFAERCEWVREGTTPSGYAMHGSGTGDPSHGLRSGESLPTADERHTK